MFSIPTRHLWGFVSLVLLSAAVFVSLAHVLAGGMIRNQQDRQLEELALIALRRAEAAIQHGADALDMLARRDVLSCDAGSLQLVRLDVYRGGALKDIRVMTPSGSVLCSAFMETLEFDRGVVTRDDMIPAGQDGLFIYPVEQFFGTALGIMRDLGERGGLAAIISAGGPALDILPEKLRAHGEVVLRMTDGRQVAVVRPSAEPLEGDVRELSVPSDLYPVEALIDVEEQALAGWRGEYYTNALLWAAALGAAFGAVSARALFRPKTPLSELDQGLQNEEFEPFFQPIFDIGTGEIRSAEVLARWVCPDGTVRPPARFIDLAEQTGRVRPMTWQIMEKALKSCRSFLAEHPDFYLSFNITPDHFTSDGFVAHLSRVVRANGARSAQVGIEITERQGFEEPAHAAAVVADLREKGFRVAIDDVGIGHSGLSQIQVLGADTMKIDKFFIDSISLDSSSNIVVEMLVRLARDKGMAIIAEGVESEAQAAALSACGVSLGQGYLIARPMAFDTFMAALTDGSLTMRGRELVRHLEENGAKVA